MAAEKLSPAAVPTLMTGLGLAEALAETGDTASANRVLDEVAAQLAPKVGLPHGVLARTQAVTLLREGRTVEARAALDRAAAIFTSLGASGAPYLKTLPPLRKRLQATAISR